jgi:hypothetical protein
MNCYECERSSRPGGTHFGVRQAVGVCQDCGVGLCPEHGKKADSGPLVCSACAHERSKHPAARPAA